MSEPHCLDTSIADQQAHRDQSGPESDQAADGQAYAVLSAADSSVADWFGRVWAALPERQRGVLIRRASGQTLQEIGTAYGISRERVRQLQKDSDQVILEAMARNDCDLLTRLALVLEDRPAVCYEKIAAELPPAPDDALTTLLRALDISNPRTWNGDLTGWWTRRPDELDRRLRQIVDLAPLAHADMDDVLQQFGLSMIPQVMELLASDNSKLARHELGWFRPARRSHDLAFLWLQQQGTPRQVAGIAAVAGTSENAIREIMRRDAAFAQVRPEGTWAIADWRVPGADNRYSNAEETIVDVLRELGPMHVAELRAEAQRRYPVSSWRITQCLSSAMIGRLEDGRYDLAERGAKPVEDNEPRRPDNIEARGHIVGVRMDVTHDVMRGSGIAVNRWLTWYLGLRIAPSVRRFALLEPSGEVIIKRATSTSQISTLRTAVQALELVEGCKIALTFNTQSDTARLHHVCDPGQCPAA